MSTSLVISMLAGISAGLIAAGIALALGWGWLVAILLYCFSGTLALVVSAVAAFALSMREPRCKEDGQGSPVTNTSLIFVSP